MYIDQSYDPNAPLANDPAAKQELIRDQERAQQLFELAFPGKQQPKPPKKVSPLLPRSVTLGEMLKVCSDLQDPVGIWTATMNDLPRSVQTRLVHYLNQLPARYRSFVIAVITQQTVTPLLKENIARSPQEHVPPDVGAETRIAHCGNLGKTHLIVALDAAEYWGSYAWTYGLTTEERALGFVGIMLWECGALLPDMDAQGNQGELAAANRCHDAGSTAHPRTKEILSPIFERLSDYLGRTVKEVAHLLDDAYFTEYAAVRTGIRWAMECARGYPAPIMAAKPPEMAPAQIPSIDSRATAMFEEVEARRQAAELKCGKPSSHLRKSLRHDSRFQATANKYPQCANGRRPKDTRGEKDASRIGEQGDGVQVKKLPSMDPVPDQSAKADKELHHQTDALGRDHSDVVPGIPAPKPNLAWAAGMLDGDGCISIVRKTSPVRKPNLVLIVTITQNCLGTLEYFRDSIGIDVPIYPTKRQAQHNKQVYVINYSGPKAQRVIERLEGLMFRKRLEAQVAIDFCEKGQASRHFGRHGIPPEILAIREACYLKLRALK